MSSQAAIDEVLAAARAREDAGDPAGALRVLERAPEPQRSGQWHFAAGTIALRLGRVEAALERFEAAVRLEPEVPEYRGNLGSALLEQAKTGDLAARARALEELETAARWGPTLPSVHTSLAVARLLSGNPGGAFEAVAQALQLDPNHVPGLYNQAAALSGLGRHDDALNALNRLLKISPGFAPALQSRANTLKRLGRK